MRTKKFRSLALAALLALGISSPASADLQQELDSLFGSMVNVTNPGAYTGQRRGVITGGSVIVRNQIANTSLLHVDFPRIDAGCGGIDIYAGGFGFVNADQFINILRAIASNAAGYAFQLAINSMCPTCGQIMGDLQKMAHNVNGLAMDSCKVAKVAINESLGRVIDKSSDINDAKTGPLSNLVGATSDVVDWWDKLGNSSASTQVPDDKLKQAGIIGNAAWNALTKGDNPLKNWYQYGDTKLGYLLMSLTGTIVCAKSSDEKVGIECREFSPTIDLRYLLDGSEANANVKIYTCDATDTGCLAPLGPSATTIIGMYNKIHNVLVGDTANGTDGLADKLMYNLNGGLSDEEKAIMEVVPQHGKAIRDLAFMSRGGALLYAEAASREIALEITYQMAREMITSMRIAANADNHTFSASFISMLKNRELDLQHEFNQISTENRSRTDLANLYKNMVEQRSGAMAGAGGESGKAAAGNQK